MVEIEDFETGAYDPFFLVEIQRIGDVEVAQVLDAILEDKVYGFVNFG